MKTKNQLSDLLFDVMDNVCNTCGKQSDAVAAFTPEHPEYFGFCKQDDRLIYFPTCKECLAKGIDLKVVELGARAAFDGKGKFKTIQ